MSGRRVVMGAVNLQKSEFSLLPLGFQMLALVALASLSQETWPDWDASDKAVLG